MKLFPRNMMSATELTKSGKLVEATALIQKTLSRYQFGNGSQDADNFGPDNFGPMLSKVKLLEKTAALPKHLPGAAIPVPKRKSAGGLFETKSYGSAQGHRNYKLFTPSVYEGKPLPLIIMLHGCSQTPDDFAAGTNMNVLAEEIGFLVAYPEQPSSANAMGCWNWFKSSEQKKESGEPAIIAGIVRQIKGETSVDQNMVYVAGLSAGGAMAAILGMTYPDMFAAIGVHSGLPCGAATSMVGAFNAMKRGGKQVPPSSSLHPVPTIVFHGDKDRTVDQVNSDDVISQFNTTGTFRATNETGKSKSGMAFSRSIYLQENGSPLFEQWMVHGAGHAWSGGNAKGSYTEPRGPDASREMIRFFFEHRLK